MQLSFSEEAVAVSLRPTVLLSLPVSTEEGRWSSCPACMRAQEHVSAVTALSLSADGWTLLSAGRDQVATLWDLRSHARLATVPTFEAVEGGRPGGLC